MLSFYVTKITGCRSVPGSGGLQGFLITLLERVMWGHAALPKLVGPLPAMQINVLLSESIAKHPVSIQSTKESKWGRNNVRPIALSTPSGPDLGSRTRSIPRCERHYGTVPQALYETVENVLRHECHNWRTAKGANGSQWSLREVHVLVYIGIDWSEQKHDIAIMNEKGGVIDQLTIAHTVGRTVAYRPHVSKTWSW